MTLLRLMSASICNVMPCAVTIVLVATSGPVELSRILRAHQREGEPTASALTTTVTLDSIRKKIGATHVQALEVTGSVERLVQSGRVVGISEKTARVRRSLTVRFQLPDRYIRIEEQKVPSGAIVYTSGFDGARLLNKTATRGKDVQFSSSWGPEQLLLEQAAFARMLLGWLVRDVPAFPLRWRELPLVEVSPGVIGWEVTGDSGFTAKLTVDAKSQRPRSLEYRTARRTLSGTDGTETRTVEFGDFRRIAGILLPFDTRIISGGEVIEQIRLTTVRVNPRFRAVDFVP
jgi:hypothetical protein